MVLVPPFSLSAVSNSFLRTDGRTRTNTRTRVVSDLAFFLNVGAPEEVKSPLTGVDAPEPASLLCCEGRISASASSSRFVLSDALPYSSDGFTPGGNGGRPPAGLGLAPAIALDKIAGLRGCGPRGEAARGDTGVALGARGEDGRCTAGLREPLGDDGGDDIVFPTIQMAPTPLSDQEGRGCASVNPG